MQIQTRANRHRSFESSKMSSPNFDLMKVVELQNYLKSVNAKVSGNKSDLINRAKLYAAKNAALDENDDTSETLPNDIASEMTSLETKRELFKENLEYSDIKNLPKSTIPENYTTRMIDEFLTSWQLRVNDENVDIGTLKPVDKGEEMYRDKLIQFAEFSQKAMPHAQDILIVRANINASMCQEVQ